MNRRVSFSPEPIFTAAATKHGGGAVKVGGGNKNRVILKIWIFEGSVGGFFKNIREKVARAAAGRRRCSRKVSSSATLARSRSYVEDSHRAEAIEDCIEFLNSSSNSLQRSNSLSSSC